MFINRFFPLWFLIFWQTSICLIKPESKTTYLIWYWYTFHHWWGISSLLTQGTFLKFFNCLFKKNLFDTFVILKVRFRFAADHLIGLSENLIRHWTSQEFTLFLKVLWCKKIGDLIPLSLCHLNWLELRSLDVWPFNYAFIISVDIFLWKKIGDASNNKSTD